MKVIAAHSPAFSNAQQTAIDLMVVFEGIGEVPFTASPDDVEPHGVELFSRAAAMEFGPVAPYVEPPVTPPTPEQTEAMRKAAYQAEADPLFFKYQRGEATREEWLAKVDEIRARYP